MIFHRSNLKTHQNNCTPVFLQSYQVDQTTIQLLLNHFWHVIPESIFSTKLIKSPSLLEYAYLADMEEGNPNSVDFEELII